MKSSDRRKVTTILMPIAHQQFIDAIDGNVFSETWKPTPSSVARGILTGVLNSGIELHLATSEQHLATIVEKLCRQGRWPRKAARRGVKKDARQMPLIGGDEDGNQC